MTQTDLHHPAYDAKAVPPVDSFRSRDFLLAHVQDTLRFYALRLHEAGMIKSSPQKIIADGTDWRFLNELKRELKA